MSARNFREVTAVALQIAVLLHVPASTERSSGTSHSNHADFGVIGEIIEYLAQVTEGVPVQRVHLIGTIERHERHDPGVVTHRMAINLHTARVTQIRLHRC